MFWVMTCQVPVEPHPDLLLYGVHHHYRPRQFWTALQEPLPLQQSHEEPRGCHTQASDIVGILLALC
jgi:hypothetical protein